MAGPPVGGSGTQMKVDQIMSNPVITIDLDAPMSRVVELMSNHRIGSLLIENRDQEIYAIITESDVVRQLHAHRDQKDLIWLWSQPVRSMVKEGVSAIKPGTLVSEAVRKMADKGIRRLPVIHPDGELMGIVTERDLLRAMSSMKWKRGT